MVIYIITKNGRTLKDEAIQYLLERLALAEKKSNYVYRCPNVIDNDKNILKELEHLKMEYQFLYYESMDNWKVLDPIERDKFIELMKDPLNRYFPLNDLLVQVMENK